MIKAIIIDDEPNCITALAHDIKMFCAEVEIIDTCTSGKEGLLSIKKYAPQLIFLDVEMPWMNGFEMLEILGDQINFQIIFTTAYSEFAAKAFRVSAVDYLLKPIDGIDLSAAVKKAIKTMEVGKPNPNINNLLDNTKQDAKHQKVAIPNRNGYEFIPVEKILYCKAEGTYTYIVLADRKLLLSKPLGETEQLLPAALFERIHHSLLVNVEHISQLRKSEGTNVIMDNGDELPVSKSKKENLMTRMGIN